MALATLALGIGINTVVFTIYGSVAFRQLPVRHPAELARFQWSSAGFPSDQFSWSEYERLSATVRSFAPIIATSAPQIIVCKLPDALGGKPGRGAHAIRLRQLFRSVGGRN